MNADGGRITSIRLSFSISSFDYVTSINPPNRQGRRPALFSSSSLLPPSAPSHARSPLPARSACAADDRAAPSGGDRAAQAWRELQRAGVVHRAEPRSAGAAAAGFVKLEQTLFSASRRLGSMALAGSCCGFVLTYSARCSSSCASRLLTSRPWPMRSPTASSLPPSRPPICLLFALCFASHGPAPDTILLRLISPARSLPVAATSSLQTPCAAPELALCALALFSVFHAAHARSTCTIVPAQSL